MKVTHTARPGIRWISLAITALVVQGCAAQGGGGVYALDLAGGARVCVAPTASPPDGQAVLAQMQVSNEGGWCGITLSRGGAAYDSYLAVTRPAHGKIFAHHVGANTRIDYTPDRGYSGADSFAVRLIPGNAVITGSVVVTR